MGLDQGLLQILVCPIDKRPLLYFADEALLYNPRLRRGYRIEAGVPVMLAGRAVSVTDEQHERLVKRAQCGECRATLGAPASEIVASSSLPTQAPPTSPSPSTAAGQPPGALG
jgi:uncharacterized protein